MLRNVTGAFGSEGMAAPASRSCSGGTIRRVPCPVCGGPAPLLGVDQPPPVTGALTAPSPVPVYAPCSPSCANALERGRAEAARASQQSYKAAKARLRAAVADHDTNLARVVALAAQLHEQRPELFSQRGHVWLKESWTGREHRYHCPMDPAVPVGDLLWTRPEPADCKTTRRRPTGVTAAGVIVIMEHEAAHLPHRPCRATHERWEDTGGDGARLGGSRPVTDPDQQLWSPHDDDAVPAAFVVARAAAALDMLTR